MLKYMLFHIKSIYKNKSSWVLLGVALASVCCLYLYQQKLSKEETDFTESVIKFTQKEADNNMSQILELFEMEEKLDEEYRLSEEVKKELIAHDREESKRFMRRYEAFRDKDYTEYLKEDLIHIKGFRPVDEDDSGSEVAYSDFLKGKILINKELIRRKLPYESTRYGTSDVMFPVVLMKYLTSGFGIVLFLILFARWDFKQMQNRKIQLVLAAPLERGKLILSHVFVFLFQAAAFLLLILLMGYILGAFFGMRIPLDYPLLTYGHKGRALIPAYEFLLKAGGLFLLALLFAYLIAQAVMLFIKNAFASIFISGLIVLALCVYSQSYSMGFNQYNPFTYMFSSKIFIAEGKAEAEAPISHRDEGNKTIDSYFVYENPEYYASHTVTAKTNKKVDCEHGAAALFGGSILMLGISYYCFKKRNIY